MQSVFHSVQLNHSTNPHRRLMSTNTPPMDSKNNRRVIIPLDDSVHSKRALDWYTTHLLRPTDQVHFVHIVEPVHNNSFVGVTLESMPSLVGTVLRVTEETIKEGRRLCREAMQQMAKHHLKAQSYLYVDTKPGHALIKAMQELKVDLIVMGNRGAGTVRRTIMGSVSNYVLHHAHVPVIIVPPPLVK